MIVMGAGLFHIPQGRRLVYSFAVVNILGVCCHSTAAALCMHIDVWVRVTLPVTVTGISHGDLLID